jgi:hypothetical protein
VPGPTRAPIALFILCSWLRGQKCELLVANSAASTFTAQGRADYGAPPAARGWAPVLAVWATFRSSSTTSRGAVTIAS